jgi:hypothetical protein
VVDLSHLEQPAAEVGPLQAVHDHKSGTSRMDSAVDVLEPLRLRPRSSPVAQVMFGDGYTPAQRQKARPMELGVGWMGGCHIGSAARVAGAGEQLGGVGIDGDRTNSSMIGIADVARAETDLAAGRLACPAYGGKLRRWGRGAAAPTEPLPGLRDDTRTAARSGASAAPIRPRRSGSALLAAHCR